MERGFGSRYLLIALFVLVLLGILFLLLQMSPYIISFFGFLKDVIGPFFIAMIISYLLNPIVNLLSQRAVPRSIAVILIYSIFLFSFVVLIMNMLPLLERQLNELAEHLPEWNERIQNVVNKYNDHGKDMLPLGIQTGIENSLSRIEHKISSGVDHMMSGIESTINQMFLAFIIPFLAFYMMKDAYAIEKTFVTLLPNKNRSVTIRLLRQIDQALGNYIRGQLLVSLVVGILAYIGYMIIGLPYPIILAGIVSVFNVIPYLGPIFGAIPGVIVALMISNKMVIGVIIVNLAIQLLEGNVISPQIVGRTLHIHPLIIIFSLLVGGELGGVIGLILAVPVFAVGKVIVEHILSHYIYNKV